MKSLIAMFAVSALLVGCVASDGLGPISQIQPVVSKEGSLANSTLIADATAALRDAQAVEPDMKIVKFVIQQPVGDEGQRAWREIWVVNPEGNLRQFIMTFKETGQSGAEFTIDEM
ncbi:hypothetical protein KUW19_07065 [Ferrimonas balearica]|uniref:hypothetical protein n=1 Tax=Ferrimonas balearica TaxID=44012 RepID=UPI001C95CE63|nr:hypothetical protein [Ferrimonas balearica]MBY6106251.1 hypothetical protein [Ferrimonas balearica]